MIRAAIRGAGYSKLIDALQNRKSFNTSGSLGGRTRGDYIPSDPGWLNDDWRKRFREDYDNIDYCVMSYRTPIAWALSTGEVVNVEQRFSVTTSRHQGAVRVWL